MTSVQPQRHHLQPPMRHTLSNTEYSSTYNIPPTTTVGSEQNDIQLEHEDAITTQQEDSNESARATLRYYKGSRVYLVLVEARKLFLVEAVANGRFFCYGGCQDSQYFKKLTTECLSRASSSLRCKLSIFSVS